MSLFVDIGQGAGLSGATGVRPFLPPLLAGALARADAGLDFSGTGWRFLESPAFLLAVLVVAVLSYGAERSGLNRPREGAPALVRRPLDAIAAALGLALGALLFAGSLAEGGEAAWPGLLAGLACAALAYAAVGRIFSRARRRLDEASAGFLAVYADAIALALAGLAILLPPLSFLALGAFVVLLMKGRDEDERKYAGLRILR